MAENENYVKFADTVSSVCTKHEVDLDSLDRAKQRMILEEAFRHFLLHWYAQQARQQLSPIYERSTDIELLRLMAVNKHHWLHSDISKMKHNGLLTALADEISDIKLPQRTMDEVLLHDYGLLIPDKWIRHHTSS